MSLAPRGRKSKAAARPIGRRGRSLVCGALRVGGVLLFKASAWGYSVVSHRLKYRNMDSTAKWSSGKFARLLESTIHNFVDRIGGIRVDLQKPVGVALGGNRRSNLLRWGRFSNGRRNVLCADSVGFVSAMFHERCLASGRFWNCGILHSSSRLRCLIAELQPRFGTEFSALRNSRPEHRIYEKS